MPGAVPPTIEQPKTVIGIGARELLLLGSGLLTASLIILSPLTLLVKVGGAVLCFGGAALAALGRTPASGKTLEALLMDLFRFHRRERLLVRNTGESPPARPADPDTGQPSCSKVRSRAACFHMEALSLSSKGLLGVLSLAFLLMLLVWIWSGGLGELLLRYGVSRAVPLVLPGGLA